LSVAKIFKYIKMIIEGTVPRDGGWGKALEY
jgi:hypothetical protein